MTEYNSTDSTNSAPPEFALRFRLRLLSTSGSGFITCGVHCDTQILGRRRHVATGEVSWTHIRSTNDYRGGIGDV